MVEKHWGEAMTDLVKHAREWEREARKRGEIDVAWGVSQLADEIERLEREAMQILADQLIDVHMISPPEPIVKRPGGRTYDDQIWPPAETWWERHWRTGANL